MKITLLAVLLALNSSAAPAGPVPANVPQRLSVGVFENTGETWMTNSGAKWDYRYRYLTWDFVSNWGNGPRDAKFALDFFRDTDARGFMPAVSLYEIYDIPPSGVGQLAKMQNPATMSQYFTDFKTLMQRAKEFNKPVTVLLEPDAVGFSQGETGGNPNTYAAIADTGMPELAGLPNTVAGWGLAFLQIRKSVGADKVVLGLHISGWATGADLFHFNVTDPLQPAVDSVYTYLSPFGLTSNITGATYDVLVGDPLDRDADFYRLTRNENRWWDISDSASINSKSMNRYMEWLRLWNLKSGKRWVLWQVPFGNAGSLNTCANGYKDNRTEWFFGPNSAAHLQKAVDNGVISVMFGEGADCQTTRLTDGNYLLNNAKAYLASTGLSLTGTVVDAGQPTVDAGQVVVDAGFTCTCTCVPNVVDAGQIVDAGVQPKPDSGTVIADAGITPVDAGKPDSGTTTDAGQPVVDAGTSTPTDKSQYNFETSTQGFASNGAADVTVAQTTSPVYSGVKALAAQMKMTASGARYVQVSNPVIPANSQVVFHVWIPSGTTLTSMQVYVQEDAATQWRWTSSWYPIANIQANTWNTFTVTVPANVGKLQSLGVEFDLGAAWTGTFYIDSIGWASGVVDAGTGVPFDAGQPVVDAGPQPKPDAGQPAADAGTVQPSDGGFLGKAFKIHTIGDSTTESVNSAFRCAMFTTLTGMGYTPTFVGTLTHPYGCTTANKHDGHAGWTAEDIATKPGDNMTLWVPQFNPDVIIYSSGINTGLWWTTDTGAQAGARQEAYIRSLFTAAPNAKVIVWTTPPVSSRSIPPNTQSSDVWFSQYNAQIKMAVTKLAAEGKPIVLVDMYTILLTSDLYDGVHPSEAAGQNKMAPEFVRALQKWLK